MNTLISKVEILKAIAHPARISILEELTKGVKCVSDFKQFLTISQPNISQHLTALRHAGLVDYFVDGRLKCYFLKSPIIPDLLEIIKKDYPEDLPAPECCPITRKGKYPGKRKN